MSATPVQLRVAEGPPMYVDVKKRVASFIAELLTVNRNLGERLPRVETDCQIIPAEYEFK